MGLPPSQLAAYSCGHFWVDFSCALLVFRCFLGSPEWMMLLLVYNFCAFALQMPIGLLADRWNRNACVAALGCLLVFAGWLTAGVPMVSVILAGTGNACFHVGGGIDVLNASTEKSRALGVYVSPGAIGIFLGTMLGKSGELPAWVSLTGLGCFAVLFLFLQIWHQRGLRSGNVPVSLEPSAGDLVSLFFCFVVVCIRSYAGFAFTFPWKTGALAAVAVAATVLGKTAGGFLADWIGVEKAAFLSLGCSALLFLGCSWPLLGLAAVFLFNFSMPITLWAAAKLLPGAKGFAFGLLTFALFLGFVPAWLGFEIPFAGGPGLAVWAVLSLILLIPGLRKERFP